MQSSIQNTINKTFVPNRELLSRTGLLYAPCASEKAPVHEIIPQHCHRPRSTSMKLELRIFWARMVHKDYFGDSGEFVLE